MIASWVLLSVLSAEPTWKEVDRVDGVRIEARDVTGSSFVELRLTATVAAEVERLCDEAFGSGKLDPEEPDLKARRIVSTADNERVTYDQISPPVVANRDYAVRARRVQLEDGACRMTFDAANELAPPVPDGWVRISKLKGAWTFRPAPDGGVALEYVIHTDPAGSIPALFVEGARRKAALQWVKLIVSRAQRVKKDAP